MYNLVIFGPPGAGKGTQSEKSIDEFNLAHISTGDMFRMHISNDTEIGKKVKQILADGLLVPDSITIEMLEEEVTKNPDVKGFIFDGFPRTVNQAEALDTFLESKGDKINLVLQLDVNQDVIKERIAERQKISGRADDDAWKLVKRIDEYFSKTIHVLPFYENQGKVIKVNGIGKIEDIYSDISSAIKNIKQSKITYLLTTTFPNCELNEDITTGDWRLLNLEKQPFNFPPPLRLINEQCSEGGGLYKDKSLGLWKVQDIPLKTYEVWYEKIKSSE